MLESILKLLFVIWLSWQTSYYSVFINKFEQEF